MRLAPIPPDQLSEAQRGLDASLRAGIKAHLHGFASERRDGALIGPFVPMLHHPQFGQKLWGFLAALMENSTLPKPAHEVVILAVGARFRSRYELYAHEHVAARAGLSAAKIATVVAGERPADLSEQEGIAYDVASSLGRGGPCPRRHTKRPSRFSGRRAWPNSST